MNTVSLVQVEPESSVNNIVLLSPTTINSPLSLYEIPFRFSIVPEALVVQVKASLDVLIIPLSPTAINTPLPYAISRKVSVVGYAYILVLNAGVSAVKTSTEPPNEVDI